VEISEQARGLNKLLCGRKVQKVVLNKSQELIIEFASGVRLFVDSTGPLEFSVTSNTDDPRPVVGQGSPSHIKDPK
jgi:hypothetical protein